VVAICFIEIRETPPVKAAAGDAKADLKWPEKTPFEDITSCETKPRRREPRLDRDATTSLHMVWVSITSLPERRGRGSGPSGSP